MGASGAWHAGCSLGLCMSNTSFDPSLYTRTPNFTLLGGITLAESLYLACPSDMSAAVKKAAAAMEKVRQAAQTACSERQRSLSPRTEDVARDIDAVCDRGWASLRARLAAYADLPADLYPKAKRAKELVKQLFPEGLLFTQRSYVEQLAAMDALLSRISDDKLEKDLTALCGPEFLENVRRQLPRYRSMVQSSLLRAPSLANLSTHLRLLSQRICEYTTKVAATVDSDDAATVARALLALAPIDSYREASARRLSLPGPDPAPVPQPGLPEPAISP